MSDIPTLQCGSPQASIIVTCKGRLHHLRRTLPSMLAQHCSFAFEAIVVDFGCPQGTFDWVSGLDVRNLVALKVLDDTAEVHVSRARNCGASIAQGAILAFVDADMFLAPNWLERASLPLRQSSRHTPCAVRPDVPITLRQSSRHTPCAVRPDLLVTPRQSSRHTPCAVRPAAPAAGQRGQCPVGLCTVANSFQTGWDRGGTCVVSAEIFHAIRGYDAALRGWGCEDSDFYARAAPQTAARHFPANLLTPIRHGDAERIAYQPAKEISQSCARNAQILAQRSGPVNPQGYGRGEFTIFRGHGAVLPPITWQQRKRIVRPVRRADPHQQPES